MQKNYSQEVIDELIDLYGKGAELSPDWFVQSYQYYDWCVAEMSRTGQLIQA